MRCLYSPQCESHSTYLIPLPLRGLVWAFTKGLGTLLNAWLYFAQSHAVIYLERLTSWPNKMVVSGMHPPDSPLTAQAFSLLLLTLSWAIMVCLLALLGNIWGGNHEERLNYSLIFHSNETCHPTIFGQRAWILSAYMGLNLVWTWSD